MLSHGPFLSPNGLRTLWKTGRWLRKDTVQALRAIRSARAAPSPPPGQALRQAPAQPGHPHRLPQHPRGIPVLRRRGVGRGNDGSPRGGWEDQPGREDRGPCYQRDECPAHQGPFAGFWSQAHGRPDRAPCVAAHMNAHRMTHSAGPTYCWRRVLSLLQRWWRGAVCRLARGVGLDRAGAGFSFVCRAVAAA